MPGSPKDRFVRLFGDRRGSKRPGDDGPLYREVSEEGVVSYYRFQGGPLHRLEGPAVITPAEYDEEHNEWYVNGVRHREGGPAVEYWNGRIEYYRDGKLHRDDGPALVDDEGTANYYRDGVLHCEGGPAIERADGSEEWYFEGALHREDGPAIFNPEEKLYVVRAAWYCHGKLHRTDGPAFVYHDGRTEYWIDGERQPDPS